MSDKARVKISGKKYKANQWVVGDCMKCAFSTMEGNGCELPEKTIAFDCLSFGDGVGVYFVEIK